MNAPGRSLTMLLGGASDALCLEVSANLARALDRSPTEGRGNADWWVEAGDDGGLPCAVEVSRLPFEREDPSRRRSLLGAADVVVVVADATDAAIPVAIAGLADVRAGLDGRPCPVMLFGIGGTAQGALEPEDLRRQLELGDQDVIVVGSSTDRARLRQVFAFAIRAASNPAGSPGAVGNAGSAPTTPAPAAPASVAPTTPAAPTTPVAPGTPVAVPGGAAPGSVAVPDITALAPPAGSETPPAAPAQVFGADDAYVEAVLNPAALSERGVVEISGAQWEVLAELVGEIALIRGSGDERRESMMGDLLGAGLIVDRRALATASPDGDVDLFNQPIVTASGAPDLEAGAGALDPGQSADDRFRALKELRRQLLG